MVRHATAESGGGAGDHERELTQHGAAQARALGTWLANGGWRPDFVSVSDAMRTRQTWQQLSGAADFDHVEVAADRSWYQADPDSAIELLRVTPDVVRCHLVLGHNPTVAQLSSLLDDGAGELAAARQLDRGFPPATAAVFAVTDWGDVGEGAGRLVDVFRAAR